jgi:hypothetical protein
MHRFISRAKSKSLRIGAIVDGTPPLPSSELGTGSQKLLVERNGGISILAKEKSK